jgi:hypothetical protein
MTLSIQKLIDDTLKNPKGSWSMKRLTIFVVLVFTLGLGAFIVLSDLILKVEVNKFAIGVFDSLLLFLATLMGLTEFGKKIENKNTKEEEEETDA